MLPLKKKEALFLYDFINYPAFVDIKQTLHYKVAKEQSF